MSKRLTGAALLADLRAHMAELLPELERIRATFDDGRYVSQYEPTDDDD